MANAKGLERALGIKWDLQGKKPLPIQLLQHGIWDIGDKFGHLHVHKRRFRACSGVKQSIDTLFEKIGPIIWPDPSVNREGWLVNAKEDTFGGLYSRDLYYSIDIDRGLLRRGFHALILHKLPAYLTECRKIGGNDRPRRYPRYQSSPENASSESSSSLLLDRVQSALDSDPYESRPNSMPDMPMAAPSTATHELTASNMAKHSRLLKDLQQVPVSGHSIFHNPDIFSNPSAPSSDDGNVNEMLSPAVLATIRTAIAEKRPTYKWRGVWYEVPADMQSSWDEANIKAPGSRPQSEHDKSQHGTSSSKIEVIDLTSDAEDETSKPRKISKPDSGTREDNHSRPNATIGRRSGNDSYLGHGASNAQSATASRDPSSSVATTTPPDTTPLDLALSSITLSIRYDVLIAELPKISLHACYTTRTLFDRIRSSMREDHIIRLLGRDKTIKAIIVYLPNGRQLRVHEGKTEEYQELVRVVVREGIEEAAVDVVWR